MEVNMGVPLTVVDFVDAFLVEVSFVVFFVVVAVVFSEALVADGEVEDVRNRV